MNRRSISGNNTEQVLQSQITDLQDNVVVTGTNLGIGPEAMNVLTTGTNNVCIGYEAGGGNYGVQAGGGNVMVGANAGGTCITGSNNTFLGYNTSLASGKIYLSGSVALGSGATITDYNQLVVASNVTSFNMSGLAASTDSTGTILEFDLGGNIAPSAGTHNTVSAIDTAISALDAPYAMHWQSGTAQTFSSSSSPQVLAVWDTLIFGNSANMASKSTWTCLASGLWNISALYGLSLSVTKSYVTIQLYKNGSSVFFTTFWVNVSQSGQGIVKNIESVLINLSSGDTLEWYVTNPFADATIGGGTTNGGTTQFSAVRLASGYTAA